MAKQLNVSLAFTADTREAKAQLQDLQKQLNNILKTPSNKLGITDEIREAISATAELSSRLQQATNVNTGNLDFSKFNNSLKQSGQSLSSYGQQLQKLGPTGQQAFLTLTKSIATAEIPIKRTNALVKEFTTTLANTARWQVSSSVLHGLMGSMQSAYRYAQDLNESLNDIRIVTGQSVDQMARFAAEANAAAKALSATTVEYTNASLIYYQQGLSDQQVKDRTDITIKMANVSKQSAEVVSEQMTAVWNNFYNGSKSLEYYADVMTALGAATASSADEIAGGLEKFAAIGETIGLSYEYAAAALATITSNTRQSEEVVGTALKTIFARIQGLNLGETLDDGTTLNKYSSALEKVGISIFDSAGELKRMDDILNEMGAKWETLNKAQQTALAQTVAGTRQYTQLVALMDNWNKGDSDSMKANLSTAYGSSGALQEQADIYAESWEAARDRVTAAAEKIYSALLNDDFFIDMLNGFEKILTFVSQLVDNLGGLQGVLLALGAIVTKVFSSQISQGLTNMAYNIKMMTKSGRESVEKERRDFIDNAVNSIPQNSEYTTDVEKAQQESLRTELTLQAEYMDNAERMSSIEAETNKKLIERTKLLREQTVELQKQKESIDTRVSDGVMDLRTDISAFNMENRQTGKALSYNDDIQPEINNIKSAAAVQAELKDLNTVIELLAQKSDKGKAALADIKTALQGLDTSADEDIARLVKEINQLGDSPDPEQLRQKLEALNIELEETIKISKQNIKDVVSPEAGKKVDALTQDLREQAQAVRDVRIANQEAKQSQEDTSKSIAGATGAQKQWSDVMVESANVAFNVATAISMVSSAIDTLKDPDVSGMQKLVTVLSTMGMVLPTIISLIGTMKKLFSSETVAKIANAAATWAQVAAEKKYNETKNEGSGITKKNIKETWQDTVWKSTKKENQDKYIEQVLKDKGYIRDKKTGSWGKTTVGKNGAKRFDASTVISNDDAVKMATPDAQKMAGKGAFKALGSKVASAGIAAAGIAIIIGTVAMVVNQLNKAEKAVEKAKAAAQSLSENYDNVKASYDNFINAQSGYETATESMEELTKGTVAYQEALMQANEAAGELLATNKNLKYTVEDGKIVIDENSLEQAKADELKKVETAQAAKIAGQRELSEAEMELKKRDAARAMKSGSDGWQKTGNAAAGGVLGAVGAGLAAGGIAGAVGGGGVFSVPAAIIGAVVGGVAGLVTGIVQETSTKTEQEAFDALAEKAETDEDFLARLKAGEVSEEEFKSIGIEDERLIASLQQNGEQVAALVGEMAANTAAINAQNDLVAANALADNEAVQDSEYKDQIIDIAGDAYGHAYDKAMESEWVDSWGKDGISKANGANKEAKKVFEEYLKYAGLEGQGYELTDTTGTDKNRQFVYKDKEGNEHKVSLEAMQAARAAYEASETLDNSATKLAETFDKLANSSNEADQALLSFVSGKNFEGASKGELEDIQNEVGDIGYNAETGEYDSSKVKAYLESSLGETLTDDVAIRYGYESADAMMDAFAKQLYNADIAWDNIKVPDNFKFADDMSLGTAKALESQIEKIELGPLGEEAGKEYVDKLNSMLSEVDTEDQQKALEALTAIDWSDWDALEQADAIMKQYGVDIDTTSEEWVAFADKMRKAAGATPDFSKLKDTLTSITAILQKLDFGSVISDEDYQKLVAYNDEWERFFMLQADGTRVFIGDSELMRETTEANLLAMRQDMELRRQRAELIKETEAGNVFGVTDEDTNYSFSALDIDTRWGDGKDGMLSTSNSNVKNYWGRTEDFTSGQEAMNWALAAEGKQAWDSDAIRAVLEEQGYGEAEWNELIEAAKQGSTEGLQAALDFLSQYINEDFEKADTEIKEMTAMTAESINELNQLLKDGLIDEEQYHKAFELVDKKEIENLDIDYEAYENLAESIEASGNAIQGLSKDLKGNKTEARDVAKQIMRYDKAVQSINESYEDWEKTLKSGNLQDQAEIVDDLREAYGNLFDIEGSSLSDGFVRDTENLKLMQEAAKGSEEAYDSLMLKVQNDIIAQCDLDTTKFDAAKAALDVALNELNFTDLEIGANLNSAGALQAMTDLVNAAGMTADQATTYLASMGVDAEVVEDTTTSQDEKTYVSAKPRPYYSYAYGTNPTTGVMQRYAFVGTTYDLQTQTVPESKETTAVGLKVISANKSSGGNFKHLNSSHGSGTKAPSKDTGGGGGSTSKPEKMETRDTTKQGDVIERYRQITDSIDNVTDALTRAERATDRLWGKDKLAAMREENKILEQQRDLILEKAKEAEEYAKEDAANLRKVADDIGVSVVIDQNTGDITNIEDVEETLYNRLAAAEAEYNAKVEEYNKYINSLGEEPTEAQVKQAETMKDAIDAYEDDVLGDIEKDIEAWEDAESQFQESIETWEDAGLEAEEILDQIMQNNYDIIMEGLEIPLSLNEEDLRLVELQLSRIEDDVYSMAEAVALTSSQFGEYQDNLRLADEALAELNRAHEAGEITDAAYQEGLGEIRDKYYENVEALMELDNTMMEYYSNTIDMANEELSKYTDQIEHQTSVLEHYSSLIELMGKSSDYKMMGKVLEGQVKTTKDAMIVSKQWYETQRANADSLAAEYAAAQARGASEEELELIKANWDAAEASANEAQDKMLSDAEAWAEALRAVLENKLADLGQTLENALTGGTSFDTINTQMERAQSLQEEYLTTTNQIYETNKLMRTAQQEIDKTTNSVAKKKLQAYIAETEQLQSQSKLSQYELDIQKAKYDLLLAEIALEEAQDTKSTVRLQRDSEGNFGYVYTADQNKLAEAQQQLEDAQNSLYNIGLEGANDYAQKYQQTMQEMYDTFADLQQQKLDGAFETEEEYHRAMEEAKAYYYQKLQDYSGLYSVAVTTDSRVVADAWSSDFADMVYDTDEWMSAVDQYVADVELAFKEWSDAVHDPSTGITAIVGGDVAAVGEKVQEVTDKSAELAKTTTEKVIPALDEELDAVQNMTGAYANMRKEIQAVIEEYTNMINRINNSQTNEWNNGNSGDGNTGGGDGDGSGGGGDTGGGDGEGSGGNTGGGDGEGSGEGAGGDETKTDSYRYGTVEFRGNGADRIWIDEVGKQYAYNSSQGKALQTAFNKAFGRNGGYKGDYWIGWTDTGGKLKADILREKDGLRTGGYTGEWAGSYGKLALLHQKELVLNAQDTENLLTSMEVLNKIVEMIDLQSMSSQLGGMLNSPSLGLHSNEVLEQNVHIEASFPGVQDRNEIEEAFNNLINKASQFANRK